MHVLSNAIHAMPDGGTATLRTRPDGDGVAIEMEDTGRGIAPEHIDKIFEPFFTTKDVWQSTGLGLAVCYSIVERHGGHVEAESELGKGTKVTIRLPKEPRVPETAARLAEPVGLQREAAVPARA